MSYKFSTQTERTNQSLHDELIAKAEAMIPVLRERSNSANSDRRIPKETIQDFKEAGYGLGSRRCWNPSIPIGSL
jgi:hypothetical protein